MSIVGRLTYAAAVLLFAGLAGTGVAHAEKPSWAGGGKHERKGTEQRGQDYRSAGAGNRGGVNVHFGDRQVTIVRQYFGEGAQAGHCPPGLAKKRNGCMPPGQAKKWQMGRPLPHDVVYYELPPQLVVQLGRPPAGHKYVRVAADILLIAVGTSMVVDAIQDLGRM